MNCFTKNPNLKKKFFFFFFLFFFLGGGGGGCAELEGGYCW